MTQVYSARAIIAQQKYNNQGVITFSKTYSNLSCPVKCSLRPVAFSTWLHFCCQKKPASWVWSKQVEWCPTFNWHQSDWLQARRNIWGQLVFVLTNLCRKVLFFGYFFAKLWIALVSSLFYDFNSFEMSSPNQL